MAPGRSTGRVRGGGDGIQAPRPTRARVTVATAALAVAGALAVAAAARAERLGGLLAPAGVLAVVGLGYGLLRGRAWAVPWALVLLGAAYTGSLFLPERGVDRHAPLVAAAFVLLAELSYWALELRTPVSPEPGMLPRRAAVVAAAGLGGLVVAALATTATALPLGGGVVWDLVGVAAAVAALVVVARLAERGETGKAPANRR